MGLTLSPIIHRAPWALCCALAVSLAAVSASAAPPAEVIMKTSGQKTPHPELTFVEGPQLTDVAAFAAWFTEAAKKSPVTRARLPVMIEVDRRLGFNVASAFIGVSSKRAGYAVKLTDKMGIPLSEHLRANCPKDGRYCGLWLEGYPRTGGALPQLPGSSSAGAVFDVVRVVSGFVDGALPPATVGRVVAP